MDRPTLLFPSFARCSSLLVLGMVVSILLLGLRMPYYNKAASDMVSVYEALVYNSRLSQDFLVYPGVVGRVLLGTWLWLLQTVGAISISKLEELPAVTNLKAYEAAWQMLVEFSRAFSLATGMACVLSFVWLVRRWIGVWQIASLAGVALAFSSGFSLGFRILRPEMMAASFVFCALLMVFLAAKDATRWRYLTLAAAGFLVALAILEKVQSIIPALAMLPLALAFGAPFDNRPLVRENDWGPRATVAVCLAALAALYPCMLILQQGIAGMAQSGAGTYTALTAGLSGRYQWVVAAAIIVTMTGYAIIWRLPPAMAVSGIAAVGLGLGLGFDLLYLQSSQAAIMAIANPIEHLQAFSAGSGASLLSQSPGTIVQTVLSAVAKSLAIHTFVLSPTHRPTLLIEWLSWAGAIAALRSGRRLLAFQIALLLGCAIGEDAIFSLRQVKVYYLPYSDPPIIMAGALALAQFKDKILTARFERLAIPLMAVYIIWGHAQPALAVYSRHDRGKVCGIVTQFTKRIEIPYCKDVPGVGMSSVYKEQE